MEILDQQKQSIEANNDKHPIYILATTFDKPAGKQICITGLDMDHRKCSNTLKEFFQDQWTMIQLTRGQVSAPMNADKINMNRQVNNKLWKDDN